LDSFPGEEKIYYSADSIPTGEENEDQGNLMYSVEYLNTIQCSGLSLAKLTLKIGCSVILIKVNTPPVAKPQASKACIYICVSCQNSKSLPNNRY